MEPGRVGWPDTYRATKVFVVPFHILGVKAESQSYNYRPDIAVRPREAPQMRQRRLALRRIFRVRDWPCGCGLIVRGFWSDAGRQVNDLSDTQLIYVGQLRVRFDEFIKSGLRSEITNGNFL